MTGKNICLEDFSAACVLMEVKPPIWHDKHGWWQMEWTKENWKQFIAVCKAYDIFDVQHAERNERAGKWSGWMPFTADTFDTTPKLPKGVTRRARSTPRKKQRLPVGW